MLCRYQTSTNSINGRLAQRFGAPLQTAIHHTSKFVCILKKNNADLTFSQFLDIQPQLEESSFHSKCCFKQCHNLLEDSLKEMGREISNQFATQNNTNKLLKSKSNQISALRRSIRIQESKIEDMENKLEEYGDDLEKAKYELELLRKQERENNNDYDNAETALVITAFIPFVNLLAVPVSYGFMRHYEGIRNEIQMRISLATSNMNECRRALCSTKSNLRSLMDDKTEKEREKISLQKEVENFKSRIRILKEEQKSKLEMQSLLQSICHLASVVHGRATVLHDETANGYSVEPLKLPLMELVEKTVELSSKDIIFLKDKYSRMLTHLQHDVKILSRPALRNF